MENPKTIYEWNSMKWEYKNKYMHDTTGENSWPWTSENLDIDIIELLNEYKITSGRALDIGTCHGIQAIGLAKIGFDVIGTEVSQTALKHAKENNSLMTNKKVDFIVDDITKSSLKDNYFDFIFDRGCFHSICTFASISFVENLKRITKKDGLIAIKVMSKNEYRFSNYDNISGRITPMPYKFSKPQIENFFSNHFKIHNIKESFFYSKNISPPARAWLIILSLQ